MDNYAQRGAVMLKVFRDQTGQIAIMVALLVPVILGIIALTVDITSQQTAKADNNSATDSAAKGLAEAVAKSRADKLTLSDEQLVEYAYGLWSQNSQKDQTLSKNKIGKNFTAKLEGDKVTVTSCATVSGFTVAGDKQVCAESIAYVSCIPIEEEKTEACVNGMVGEIIKKRVIECPAGSWTPWMIKKDTCTPECVPTVRTEQKPCPEGLTGAGIITGIFTTCPNNETIETQISYACSKPCVKQTENRKQQCSTVLNNPKATGLVNETRSTECPSGNWQKWVQVSNTCCEPDEQERSRSCGEGYTGKVFEKRTKTCPSGSWGDWTETKNTCEKIEPDCNEAKYNVLNYQITSHFEDEHTSGQNWDINPYLKPDFSDEKKTIVFEVSIFKNEKLRIAAGTGHADTDEGSAAYAKNSQWGIFGTYKYDGVTYDHMAQRLLKVCNERYGGGDNYKCNSVTKNYEGSITDYGKSNTDYKAVYEPSFDKVKKYVKVTGQTGANNSNYVEAKLLSCEQVKEEDFKKNVDQVSAKPLNYKLTGEWYRYQGGWDSSDSPMNEHFRKGENLCPCTQGDQYFRYCDEGFYSRTNYGKYCVQYKEERVINKLLWSKRRYTRQ